MVIGIDEPKNICQLLFIRNAWGMAQGCQIPMCRDPLPDVGSSAMPSSESDGAVGAVERSVVAGLAVVRDR